jgi:ADP-heptose:LPS heptosyltransferase
MRILVKRIGALGDVVLTTPIIRRLRRENPEAEIGIQTGYAGVFANSPHAITTLEPGPLPHPWTPAGGLDRVIDLDLAYERQPDKHIVEAYMLAAFGDAGDLADMRQELFWKPIKAAWPTAKPMVAIHAAKAGWRNRTLPESTWLKVIDGVRGLGAFPLLVGTMKDQLQNAKAAVFYIQDPLAQASVISRCAAFVSSDSGLLHVAGATDVPIVGVFTCADPLYRMPIRYGDKAWSSYTITPPLECIGCLGRRPPPVTTESCERGDIACVREVDPSVIVECIENVLRGTTNAPTG